MTMHMYTESMRAGGYGGPKLAETRTLNDPRAVPHTYNGPNTYHEPPGSPRTGVSLPRVASSARRCSRSKSPERSP